ncbi:F0F1 ATP synthase subunit C [Streptococcus sp. Marseille-Q5986]|uniref:F0F1 ATP synthase subunit C n=1 Tax=Streptococcus sp. Marseille-Q5986 TaxID=2972782 RepID=UPI0022652877|nr:F0F1 ATP synthase subunit C [Streptococcus sp. Marseille-Q5986]
MNLTFFGLCLACMGVSLAEGFLMNGLLKSAARQPDIIAELRSLMIMGIAFIEGTFLVTLVFSFIIK